MVTLKRPARTFSFTDFQQLRPREPAPGDRLDSQFDELIDAINQTQDALREIRRDDGALRSGVVTEAHLRPGLLQSMADELKAAVAPTAIAAAGNAASARDAEHSAQLYAADAEKAVLVAQQLVAGMTALRQLIESKSQRNMATEQAVEGLTNDAQDWANLSHAMADNAIKAKNEALAWAEFLGGPCVDAASAPAYIANTPFPNGLFYQPVEGGVAGLWSAKWWALQAYGLVGAAGQFFLGPWPVGPLPGEQNPNTGQVIPNPIPPGAIYYDITSHQIMVWDGTAWQKTVSLAPTVQFSYVYQAAANQQNFSGPDLNGQTPDVGDNASLIYVNGVRLVPTVDFTINAGTDTLHINAPLTLGSIVQWDFLAPPAPALAAVKVWKMLPFTPDGTEQNFPLNYMDGSTSTPANVGASAELAVSLDGVLQEPDVDYSAAGSALHLITAPPASAHIWAVWHQPEIPP